MRFNKRLPHAVSVIVLFVLAACQSDQKEKQQSQSAFGPDSEEDSIRIAVTGQVPQPGYYTVSKEANISTVLVQAGWTPYFAEREYSSSPIIWVKRLGEGTQESWILDMSQIYKDKWMNFQLKDGDIINVMIILF